MRIFWEFRSNIKHLEYYHKYKDLKTFKENCHDYYMLFPLWMLENDHFDQVIIWRLTDVPRKDIVFNVNGKKYIQRWVSNFKETLNHPSPDISFWRGGFQEYDNVTRINPKHFGKKLYLGAGWRTFPQWNGKYDVFLIEDERDVIKNQNCIPFYKTASPSIFKPLDYEKKWDICWPCNFTQIKYKGQKLLITLISERPELQKLKIVHCGNKPEVGKEMCKRLGVKNIDFMGLTERKKLNELLNMSRFGLNLSNMKDGCPRVSTEILMSGTPLILRNTVRLLRCFRKDGVVNTEKLNLEKNIMYAMQHYDELKKDTMQIIKSDLSFDNINQKNINLWKKI